MKQELNLTEVEKSVLRFIRLNPGRSRVEIAARLGLSKSMLSKAVGTFEQTNLVAAERSRPGEGDRGQPPIKLSLNDSAFHSIGVYVTRRHCVTVLSDLGGRSKRCIASEGPFEGSSNGSSAISANSWPRQKRRSSASASPFRRSFATMAACSRSCRARLACR